MDLPPELLDEIIEYVSDETIYLRNCSLVAKSWVYPSRRRLFDTIHIWGDADLKSWLDTISPTNVRVLQHVRSLQCQIADPPESPRPSIDLLRDYSPSFRRLKYLTLYTGFLPPSTQISSYSAFQHTLSDLSLYRCTATANGIVTLVNYFPNLASLDLGELCDGVGGQPAPSFSRPIQKLFATDFYTDDSLGFLDRLMGLRPQCEDIIIYKYQSLCPSLAQHVVNGVEACMKRLCLLSALREVGNPLSLSNCRELRKLEIYALSPGTAELNLIASITSANIRMIAFTQPYAPHRRLVSSHHNWTELDNLLCRLVDRSEPGVRLEVKFRALDEQAWWSEERGFRKHLPRFYEKGVRGK